MDTSVVKYWKCSVLEFNIRGDVQDYSKSYIDLTLEESGEIKTLRFLNPRQITLENDYSNHEGALNISDCSNDGMEHINLRVSGEIINLSNFSFWAEDVVQVLL